MIQLHILATCSEYQTIESTQGWNCKRISGIYSVTFDRTSRKYISKMMTAGNSQADHIKGFCRKIQLLCRNSLKIYSHIWSSSQYLRLLYLFRRNIRFCPLCTVLIHISRKHACAGSDIQNPLPFYTESPIHNFLIKFLRIDISVPCIFPRSLSSVKGLSGIYSVIFYFHMPIPSSTDLTDLLPSQDLPVMKCQSTSSLHPLWMHLCDKQFFHQG